LLNIVTLHMETRMRRKVIAAGCIALVLGTAAVATQAAHQLLYGVDTQTGEVVFGGASRGLDGGVVLVAQSGKPHRSLFTLPEGQVNGLAVAPVGNKVAVLGRRFDIDVPRSESNFTMKRSTGDRYGFERTRLWIVSSVGERLGHIDQVRSFSWRRDGSHLAIVTGDYVGYDIEPKTTGVWIYEITKGGLQRLPFMGNRVVWARFDDGIYVWDTAVPGRAVVRRYDLTTGLTAVTPYHAIGFSPSGNYYFKPDGIAGPPAVYYRPGNTEISVNSRALADLVAFEPQAWAPDADKLLVEGRRRSDNALVYRIYDPATDTATDVLREGILGWGGTSTELLVAESGTFVTRRIADLLGK
jgi:hypothetical protein